MQKKLPWHYNMSAIIPHRDMVECLEACVACLRWQTEPPHILIIDTGSTEPALERLLRLRADDLAVVSLGKLPYRHPCALIAAAIDVGLYLCQTDRAYLTHIDVFLKSRDWLERMRRWTCATDPVVGYEMSPRKHVTTEWRGMVGHTSTCLYMPTMRHLGLHWSMIHAMAQEGLDWDSLRGWPDTETCFGRLCRRHMIEPLLVGAETNEYDYEDRHMVHVRSATTRLLTPGPMTDEREQFCRYYRRQLQLALDRVKTA